jgi:YD repeat-containing protein
LKTLAANRKNKAPVSTGFNKHLCSKLPANIGLSISGRMATVTDQRGILMVSNIFYPDGRVQKQTLADGAIYQFAYTFHPNGKVATTTVTDGRNNVRTLTYTDKSRLLSETFGTGSPAPRKTLSPPLPTTEAVAKSFYTTPTATSPKSPI